MAQLTQAEFEQKVKNAIARVDETLQTEKLTQSVADAPHTYEDKFGLATFIGNMFVRAAMRSLQALSATVDIASTVALKLRDRQRATLHFRLKKTSNFLRTVTHQVDSPVVSNTTTRRNGAGATTSSFETVHKVTNTVKEHIWKVDVRWVLEIQVHDTVSGTKRDRDNDKNEEIHEESMEMDDDMPSGASTKPPSKKQKHTSTAASSASSSSSSSASSAVSLPRKYTSSPDVEECPPTFPRVVVLTAHDFNFEELSHSDKKPSTAEISTNLEVPISMLLRAHHNGFKIDRTSPLCRTPRRNPEIEKLLDQMCVLPGFIDTVYENIASTCAPSMHPALIASIASASAIFVPCMPLLVNHSNNTNSNTNTSSSSSSHGAGSSSDEHKVTTTSVVSKNYMAIQSSDDIFMHLDVEHNASLAKVLHPANTTEGGVVVQQPSAEVQLSIVLKHIGDLAIFCKHGIISIELRLREQLLAAVSNELSSRDFTRFMRFHYNKLMLPMYRPRLASFDVRRPGQTPEGSISMIVPAAKKLYCGTPYVGFGERCKCGGCNGRCGPNSGCQCPQCETKQKLLPTRNEEIMTLQRNFTSAEAAPMHFAIRASTHVTFKGERIFHSWMRSQFADLSSNEDSLALQINARQFSCFMVLIGNVTSASVFEPQHAFVVRNKDEFLIPLLLHKRASAAEFQDHLQGLSPEQQRVAKLLREIQLSSLFGILILDIKPQLERVLNLPAGSLVKETELTESLLELFIKYQIPSVQLEVLKEDSALSVVEKLSNVRKYVEHVHRIIYGESKKVIRQRKLEKQANGSTSSSNKEDASEDDEDDDCDEEMDAAPVGRSATVAHYNKGVKKGGGGSGRSAAPAAAAASVSQSYSTSGFGCASFGSPAASASTSFGSFVSFGSTGATISAKVQQESCVVESTNGLIAAKATANNSRTTTHSVEFQSEDEVDLNETEGNDDGDDDEDEDVNMPTTHEEAGASSSASSSVAATAVGGHRIPWTQFPQTLDKVCGALGADAAALCPTRVEVGDTWIKTHAPNILAPITRVSVDAEKQKVAKRGAFDLIDALTRTGALPFDDAKLHIMMITTQNFSSTLVDTCIIENVDPIQRVERAMMLVGANLFKPTKVSELVKPQHAARFALLDQQALEAPLHSAKNASTSVE